MVLPYTRLARPLNTTPTQPVNSVCDNPSIPHVSVPPIVETEPLKKTNSEKLHWIQNRYVDVYVPASLEPQIIRFWYP